MAHFCSSHGIEALPAKSLSDAQALLASHEIAVAFVHLHGGLSDEEGSGLLLLEDDRMDEIEALFMSEHDNPRMADAAIRKGASYFFCKPFDPSLINAIFKDIVQDAQPAAGQESTENTCAVDQFGFLRGSARSMRKLYRLLRKVAQTDASLMIVGESGTGKELVAQTVHALSPRSCGPFIAVNCAAVSETLIESELFGHEKGSFSGAHSRHKGFFEQAHGGTLFLDEITEMDLHLQTKLLRVLETKEFRRLGSEETIAVDVRFLSATNRSPEIAVAENELREDLYYRLAQFPVRVPPLRQRGSDIPGLAQYFLNALNEKHNTNISFTDAALQVVGSKNWPGNVRELKNYVERAYIMSHDQIDVADLPDHDSPVGHGADSTEPGISMPSGIALADAEKTLILDSLERNQGDKKIAAKELGVSLKTLYNRLRDYESEAPDPEAPPEA